MTEQKQSFEPIKQARIFEEIASQIRRQLATGKLKRGDKLPAERELAVQLGVGRKHTNQVLESFLSLDRAAINVMRADGVIR